MHQVIIGGSIIGIKEMHGEIELDFEEHYKEIIMVVKIIGKHFVFMEVVKGVEISGIVDSLEGMEPTVNFIISVVEKNVQGNGVVDGHENNHEVDGNYGNYFVFNYELFYLVN